MKEFANLTLMALMTAVKENRERGGRRQTYLVIDEFQQMASESFKLVLRQARSFGLSLILANQSEADLMTKQTNRLLDTVRANTQLKIYLSVSDPNTIKWLEKASGLIAYEREDGMIDYDQAHRQRHSALQFRFRTRDLLGHQRLGIYRLRWRLVRFKNELSHHGAGVSEAQFGDLAAATEATILAERTKDGPKTFIQGTGENRLSSTSEVRPKQRLRLPCPVIRNGLLD